MYKKVLAAAKGVNYPDVSDKEVNQARGFVAKYIQENPEYAEAANYALEQDPYDVKSTDEAMDRYNRSSHPEHKEFHLRPRPAHSMVPPLLNMVALLGNHPALSSSASLLPDARSTGLLSPFMQGLENIWNLMPQDPLRFPGAEAMKYQQGDFWQCMDGSQVLPGDKLCDNIEDCNDQSDETCCLYLRPACFLDGVDKNLSNWLADSISCTGEPDCDGGTDELLAFCKYSDKIDDIMSERSICNNSVTILPINECTGGNVCGDMTFDEVPYCQERVDSGEMEICQGSNQIYDPKRVVSLGYV